jgi:hypothetical protein
MIVPAYAYPAPAAPLWDGALAAADCVRCMVANPANGPGTAFDGNYAAVVARVKAAGIHVMGYVDTHYSERKLALVKADIDAWKSFYGVTDAFVDQTASSADKLAYYREIGDQIHATPGAIALLNPGTNADEGYLQVADILNIFEGNQAAYEEFDTWSWTAGYPSSRFSHLVYGVADEAGMTRVVSESVARGVAHVYVTSGGLPHPWGALPPYWEAEVARIRRS